jgi:prepilin-type N-terminal cleavage/methylation domain-containing protein
MMMYRNWTARAFTLIEILVVVVILGIAATLVIPQLSSAGDLNAASAARVVLADLNYAQNCAITTQKPCFVSFSKSTNSDTYSLLDSVAPSEHIMTHPVTQMAFTQILGSGGSGAMAAARLGTIKLEATSTATTIAFDSLGSPYSYSAGTGLVAMTDAGTIDVSSKGFVLRISVEPYTGELSVTKVTP